MSSRRNNSQMNSPDYSDDDDDDFDDDTSEGDEDIHQEEDNLQFHPIIISTTSFKTLKEAIQHDVQNHQFDLLPFLPSSTNEDFFEMAIVRINQARSFVQQHAGDENVGSLLTQYMKEICQKQSDDDDDGLFFKPVLEDDALLMCIDDLQDLMEEKEKEQSAQTHNDIEGTKTSSNSEQEEQLKMRISALEEQLARAKACITSLATESDNANTTKKTADDDDDDKDTKKKKPDNDTYYFTSYSHSSIHETMLQDTVRTESYQNAILQNASTFFENKVVMDIGCGTGILSLFCAKAGARKVIAIDASDVHVEAREHVKLNGYEDVITVVHGKLEDLIANHLKSDDTKGESSSSSSLLPLEKAEKVDVIVSEWMGYALFFETMLPSVIVARDALMKTPPPQGQAGDSKNSNNDFGSMFPNGCDMWIEGATDSRLDYWDDVYGMNMKPMKKRVGRELKKGGGEVEVVPVESIVTDRAQLKTWDLNTCLETDQDFEAPFVLKPKPGAKVHKLVVSFDIQFDVLGMTNPVHFSTGCQTEPTHWKQTSLWIDPMGEEEGGGQVIQEGEVMKGTFSMIRNKDNHRAMDFVVLWEIGSIQDDNFVRRCNGSIVDHLGA